MSLSSASIPKLTSDNFLEWKFLIDPFLLSEDLTITAVIANGPKNAKALVILRSTVSQQVQSRIRSFTCAFKTYEFLIAQYGTSDPEATFERCGILLKSRMNDGERIATYVARLTDLKHHINSSDSENLSITNDLFKVLIYCGLTDPLKQSARSWSKSEMTLETFVARLTDLQGERKKLGTALHAGARHQRPVIKHDPNSPARPECSHCKRTGHLQSNCFVLHPQLRQSKARLPTVKKEKVHMTLEKVLFSSISNTSNQVLLDCGCSTTCSGDPSIFTNLEPVTDIAMEVGDSRSLLATHRGDVTLHLADHEFIIRGALLVPKFGNRLLISMADLTRDADITVTFQSDYATLLLGGEILCKLPAEEGVYPMPLNCLIHPNHDSLIHERMGHVSRRVLINSGIPCPPVGVCDGCVKGDHPSHKYSHRPAIVKTTRPLQLVHTDLCGPMDQVSLGGARYVCTMIDDFTRKGWVKFISSKAEAADSFLQMFTESERQSGCVVQNIKSDGGGEYKSASFLNSLSSKGVVKHVTPPYAHQQNGVAERFNRTIIARARKMLHHRNHHLKFWAEAVNHATLIYNNTWHSTIKSSPEFKWSGKSLPYTSFKVWGCRAWVRIPKEKRKKLQVQSTPMMFLGNDSTRGGFKLYDPSHGKIVYSRDVIFDENQTVKTSEAPSDEEVTLLSDIHRVENPSPEHPFVEEIQQEPLVPQQPAVEDFQQEPPPLQQPFAEDFQHDPEQLVPPNVSAFREFQLIASGTLPQPRIRTPVKRLNLLAIPRTPPASVEEALSGNEACQWKNAMDKEMESMKNKDVFVLTPATKGMRTIKSKWVFSYKPGPVGSPETFKARWVAKGFTQRPGMDYGSVFSPVIRHESIKILLTLACTRNLLMRHVDIKTAFLHGDIDRELYVSQPSGYNNGTSDVCKLNRSLYGLKQSPRLWNAKLTKFFVDEGFRQADADPCIFIHTNGMIVGVYVDDMLLLAEKKQVFNAFIQELNNNFDTKDLGEPKQLLGLTLTNDPKTNRITLSQRPLIRNLIHDHGLDNCKPTKEPVDPSQVLMQSDTTCPESDTRRYRESIGKLNYLAQCTRPDLAIAVSILSRFFQNPSQAHFTALAHVIRYLAGTEDLVFTICPSSSEMTCYSDADWGRNVDTRKSTSGYCIMFGGSLISWKSKGQTSVALSTMEAEYMALAYAVQEVLWIRQLLNDLGEHQEKATRIFEDNQACIHFTKEQRFHGRAKHVDIKFHFVRDIVQKGLIDIIYCPTEVMLADMFTKPLSSLKLKSNRLSINLLPSVQGEC